MERLSGGARAAASLVELECRRGLALELSSSNVDLPALIAEPLDAAAATNLADLLLLPSAPLLVADDLRGREFVLWTRCCCLRGVKGCMSSQDSFKRMGRQNGKGMEVAMVVMEMSRV